MEAGKKLKRAGLTIATRIPRCYVLTGYPKDTIEKATARIYQTIDAGFIPFAMAYRDDDGKIKNKAWREFAWIWLRMKSTMKMIDKYLTEGIKT